MCDAIVAVPRGPKRGGTFYHALQQQQQQEQLQQSVSSAGRDSCKQASKALSAALHLPLRVDLPREPSPSLHLPHHGTPLTPCRPWTTHGLVRAPDRRLDTIFSAWPWCCLCIMTARRRRRKPFLAKDPGECRGTHVTASQCRRDGKRRLIRFDGLLRGRVGQVAGKWTENCTIMRPS
ncbi:hypothetical protein VFPBJ_04271 [Purpureocillium lilacinum]|uniref:Uncharacterized protein n=1 Tax=Purpureocillium lilacinum TaxID=33203 RepID=A0A179GUR0_PURLI|nr:hypothetical protein VFPBJ_04271 [Purpureocillium lilacinum]